MNAISEHITPFSLSEINNAAREVLAAGKGYTIWLFQGEMGAGKTTFIKAICKELNVVEQVSSPTFSIVNEYETQSGSVVYHFDFYRLKSESEAQDIGVDEYFYSGNLCLIEWPEKISSILPDKFLLIRLEEQPGQKRTVYIEKHDG